MFKKYDVLELIDKDQMAASIGSLAIVIGEDLQYVDVRWVGDCNSQMDGEYSKEKFELKSKKEEENITLTWIPIEWEYIFYSGKKRLAVQTPLGKKVTKLYCIETGETKEI